jgi:hypothetical protein
MDISTGNKRVIILDAWVKAECPDAGMHGVSKATLYRWRNITKGAERHLWAQMLSDRYKYRCGRDLIEITDIAWDYFVGLYMTLLAPTASDTYRRTQEAAERNGWGEIPSICTFKRRIKSEFTAGEIILQRQGKEALDRCTPSQRRDISALGAMQSINADGLPLDVRVLMPDGRIITHPSLWLWQDVATRYPLSWELAESENTDQIRRTFASLVDKYGLWTGPGGAHITIDNTRAASNKQMSGGSGNRHRFKKMEGEANGIFNELGLQIHWTSIDTFEAKRKGRGQAKPVERLFRELQDRMAKAPECAGAYLGRSTMHKPADYGTKTITWEDFHQIIERELIRVKSMQGRRTQLANGRSLEETFRDAYGIAKHAGHISFLEEQKLKFFFLASQTFKVRQDSTIHIEKNRYTSEFLMSFIGQEIMVRFNPENLHSDTFAFKKTGEFIGPLNHIADTGFYDTEAAREWKKNKKQSEKAIKKSAEAKIRMKRIEVNGMTWKPDPVAGTAKDNEISAIKDLQAHARSEQEAREAERQEQAIAIGQNFFADPLMQPLSPEYLTQWEHKQQKAGESAFQDLWDNPGI